MNVGLLKQLVDDNAIEYIRKKNSEYDKLFDNFIKTFKGGYIIGIDLASGDDITVHTPP